MQRIDSDVSQPLHGVQVTRAMELALAATLPAHTLMQRAGLASARLALALAPHADTYWIACGPGNNGGDGLQAAVHLRQWGKNPVVTLLGSAENLPVDASTSLRAAQDMGVQFVDAPPPNADACIDALLGLGSSRAIEGHMAQWIAQINAFQGTVLSLDLPTGLNANTGCTPSPCVRADHTLSLLTLKPGLFTAQGRDMAGQVWLDDLGAGALRFDAPNALLLGQSEPLNRAHASHKGSFGDVAVIGGASGMTGAAWLAASAALHQGAGRVFVCLLDKSPKSVDPIQPELMVRDADTLDVAHMTVVCGCGGGEDVATRLPKLLSQAPRLVLDADALNAIAADAHLRLLLSARHHRARATVITPHPLEAARLLGCDTAQVQNDRLDAAQTLAQSLGCTVVLKGSGTVIASPGGVSTINPTGNARLASAGTGDVLAGMVGALLSQGLSAVAAAQSAVWWHGHAADKWPADQVLVASELARSHRSY
jgi:ADP-dependent NAD(P)H-hydrate dehydratase / NAD(P)H-hydrate epimerase